MANENPEIRIAELSGHERKALQHLLVFLVTADDHGKGMKSRLQQFPNGWRDWRLMVSLARKLLGQLYETLTPRHYQQMKLLEMHGECSVGIKPATKTGRVEFVHEAPLDVVIKHSMDGNCRFCVRDEAGIHGCKLRKALFDIKPPMDIPKYGCVYREIAHDESWDKEME